ncbi:alginate export family protein [Sediminitomix flava]|uniref:Alginate export protein n=1 Tax=Sediminitomix flava TaxID=379075 RepID=A0A315ZBV8_SEDFL|nr:alginate export family protein [Sediminitomix flava]PWJ43055.1 alginate export protein [Sediminitomix flava]
MKKILAVLLIFVSTATFAQEFKLSGDFRARYEYRDGFKAPVSSDHVPASFISQRARINMNYLNKEQNLRFGFSMQDVRTWGDESQLVDDNQLGVHEAWGEILFTDKFSLKIGRQELVYDDSRILGNVDWAMQGRSHDLALFKYEGDFKFHAGAAYNADGETLGREIYNTNYKAMQFAWFNKSFSDLNVSVLFLNNGIEYSEVEVDPTAADLGIAYSQTIGTRLTYSKDGFAANAAYYYQGGKDGANNELNAYYVAGEASYKVGKFKVLAGTEVMSGTDQDATDGVNRSFNPFYGTNHKFNGLMDYFYVGNHANNVGLGDYYVGTAYNSGAFTTGVRAHFFSAMANLVQEGEVLDSNLGTELDFTASYKFSDAITFQAGYSVMNASDEMLALKATPEASSTNHWGWAMVVIKPSLLHIKK